jgi:multidrug efflux pump subunit AcrB
MKGAIEWMARNGVAPNLLMVFILAAGAVSLVGIKQEVFPEFSLKTITISVEYPGASPKEVEEGIVQKIEERIESVEGIRRINSVAAENLGSVTVELLISTDATKALDDIKTEIDRITSFPIDAEKPEVAELTTRQRVIDVVLFGAAPEGTLKELANQVKDDLSAFPEITYVQVAGVRSYEVSIEVSQDILRAYGLRLSDIAGAVRQASLDLPAGNLITDREEFVVRIEGQNYTRADFEEIIVLSRETGAQVRLADIATVRDGFEDSDLVTMYNGQPAVLVQVFRSGDERVLEIVDRVEAYLTSGAAALPSAIEVDIWQNDADNLQSRLSLLVRNGRIGLLLVIVALTVFLNIRLSFWTAIGIAISFVGAFAIMAVLDVSINLLSLFGFILAIGIVVDDAIVVGENIFAERRKGTPPLEAAIKGVKRVAVPVTFAVLTSVAAFTPLLFVPGMIGNFLKQIPIIVIAVLVISLIEALFILPHHLSNLPEQEHSNHPISRRIALIQDWVRERLQRFVHGPLDRAVRFAVQQPGVVVAGATALFILSIGVVAGRYIKFSFFPEVEGDLVNAQLELPEGTTVERTTEIVQYIEAQGRIAADQLRASLPARDSAVIVGVFTSVGRQPTTEAGPAALLTGGPPLIRANVAEVSFKLLGAEERRFAAEEFERRWREAVGPIPSARKLTFSASAVSFGDPVDIELSHPETAQLDAAVDQLMEQLRSFAGVFDVRSDREQGKREIELTLKPRARTLGLTLDDVARQVRSGFFGNEALRIQRGDEEIRVYVRLPEDERNAVADLNDYWIRVPAGGSAPLPEVAVASLGRSPSAIRRVDGRRIQRVTGDVDVVVVTGDEVNAALRATVLPALGEAFPGLQYSFGGGQRQQNEALGSMARGFVLALLVMYALLAIPFRSYGQPLIVMSAIPFGFVGALIGHLALGLNLGLLSIFGIVGLSGVVVNDSLVMIDFVNELHRRGIPIQDAVVDAAKARFRPIMLTSLTTFLGISPLLFERSLQAQFLVPMAVSLGFGIIFATGIILVLIPALTVLQHRAAERLRGFRGSHAGREARGPTLSPT